MAASFLAIGGYFAIPTLGLSEAEGVGIFWRNVYLPKAALLRGRTCCMKGGPFAMCSHRPAG